MKIRNISAVQAILLALFFTGLINIAIFILQTNGITGMNSNESEVFFPSSKIIGLVWSLLIAGLAFSFSKTIKKQKTYAVWIFVLFLFCIFYPVYTFGFSNLRLMIAGNLMTVTLASFISGLLYSSFKIESFIIFLISLWVMFVTYLMFFIN